MDGNNKDTSLAYIQNHLYGLNVSNNKNMVKVLDYKINNNDLIDAVIDNERQKI